MSTRSTVIDLPNIHVWEETSEPQMVFGKDIGFNVYLSIDISELKLFKVDGEYFYIRVKKDNYLPTDIKIWGGNIIWIEWDSEGLMVGLKGGSKPANEVLSGKFDSINNNSTN